MTSVLERHGIYALSEVPEGDEGEGGEGGADAAGGAGAGAAAAAAAGAGGGGAALGWNGAAPASLAPASHAFVNVPTAQWGRE
jgi:hypothetical protein